ncbi:unnamed protein product [Amaranthus hypochondriacus]
MERRRRSGWRCRNKEKKEKTEVVVGEASGNGGNTRWGRGMAGKDRERRAKIPLQKERKHVDRRGWQLVNKLAGKCGDSWNTVAAAAAAGVENRGEKQRSVSKGEISREESNKDGWPEKWAV